MLLLPFVSSYATASDPVNQWILYHEYSPKDWRRQNHGGIAFDPSEDSIYLFGSDTHGSDTNNAVYQFGLDQKQWLEHYPPSVISTYRISEAGQLVAGDEDTPMPWAMHTFDNIVFDPARRALVITAFPEHNPLRKKMPRKGIWSTWLYHVDHRSWSILNNDPQPKGFAGASAYDSKRQRVLLYKWRMSQLPSAEEKWQKAGPGNGHQIHYMMEYDSHHDLIAVFGDHKNSNRVHLFYPDGDGPNGYWEIRQPEGDKVPEDQHFPVAFSTQDKVFLLVPDDTAFKTQPSGYRKPIKPKQALTFIYDIKNNQYLGLPKAQLPPLGMNYCMVYSPKKNAFFLLSGTTQIKVWQLKLDLAQLAVLQPSTSGASQ
ncbi:hypothetical protein MIB92_03470 [Aestuariirhabdus sp. Z084]|uniref:hypothetical protein n=1 Tax=Aestuariirhabdus haliotis TaxID=2918751 RepID=UPI00201B44FC|nr:hypothetical protein [Aestuariirhabdus haliotis]MCL6414700.1 hypothetical protein [Aestuariirhabdus haliotis]MCL6418632.1 hypothetical protein [Aestuariirhabdus haliotis]